MNLVQQLAEYQNAPIQSLEMAKKGANPAISPWVAAAILSDRIEKQKRMGMEQGAAMGPQPTVADQQDQELSGIMQAMPQQGAPQAPPAQEPVMAAEGGLMSADVDPGMYDYCGGGIIAFGGGGQAVADADDMSQPATDTPYFEQMANVLGLVPEALKALVSAPGHGLNKERKEAPKKARDPQEAEILRLAADVAKGGAGKGEIQDKAAFDKMRGAKVLGAPAGAAPAGGAPAGAAKDSGIMAQLTSSSEWADLDAARKKQFEAPNLPTTAAAHAAEKAAHLKAQGITEAPWEASAKQTAELRRIMGDEDATRKKEQAERERDERYDTFVANLGSGSFGQSAQGGLRANLKREADLRAEDQRIKELRYNQNLKLNEIDAKAKELRYNEATGDVAAAQKNRKEIAELKNEFEKNKIAIAKGQAGIREQGLAAQLSADTQLKAAGMRAAAGVGSETKETQMAEAAFARDPEAASIKKQLEGHMSEAMRIAKVRRLREIQAAKYKQFGLTLDGTMSAPSAAGAGGTASGKWGPAQVVK